MRASVVLVLASAVLAAAVARTPAQTREDVAEVTAMYRRAAALKEEGKFQEAALAYEKVLEKARVVFGVDHVNTAGVMNNLANLYRELGQHEKAEPLFKRSIEIAEVKLGKDHPNLASALNNLGHLYSSMARYDQAEKLFDRSLKIREGRFGKDHPAVAESLNNIAMLYYDRGDSKKAQSLFERSRQIYELRLGKDHPAVANCLNSLGELCRHTGQYDKAERLLRQSIEIYEKKFGKSYPELSAPLNHLALVQMSLGQYEKAEPLLKRAIEITEASQGKDHPAVATSLGNLAILYKEMGQLGKAVPLYLRSYKIRMARLGPNHPDVAISLNSMAEVLRLLRSFKKAEIGYRDALQLQEKSLGKDHPALAQTLNNMAILYEDMGQHDKAKPLLLRSLKICETRMGKDHPTVETPLNNLASLYARADEPREAARFQDQARRHARRYIASVLPVLSESEKATFFENTTARANLEAALSLGLANRDSAAVVSSSATWLLNGKGVDQESLAASAVLSRQSSDPELGKLSAELLSVRQQLARLTLTMPRPGQEKQHLERIEELSGREQELARKLRRAGSTAILPTWVELADLRKVLPADAVLIDVARFKVFNFKHNAREKKFQPARYVAWLTAKTGPVRLIDLGPASKIDAAVTRYREGVSRAAKTIREKGEEKAEKALREQIDTLSALLLKPLLPYVGTKKRWVISPDGTLWLLPWEVLTLKDGKYAVEKHQISYLISGRDLIASVAPRVKQTAPLVLADPDFDLSPDKARAEAKRLLGSQREGETRSLSRSLVLEDVPRLRGTAVEAKAITPSLKAYAKVAPRVYVREQAQEAVLKSVRSPRVLVLCTHGYFLADQKEKREGKDAAKAPRWENPLLRCGLLLAGCNNASKEESDDGVLTGLEVVGVDLRGCELVVLSACETGVGTVQNGEGVSGLRQAFQLAGAQAVVSTLWQVPDKQSARLMSLFFRNLSKGMSKAEALRAAKLKLIEERREDFAAAHPFFWAAFTLTGGF